MAKAEQISKESKIIQTAALGSKINQSAPLSSLVAGRNITQNSAMNKTIQLASKLELEQVD